jgi:NAD(P)-dependent dehydrogenase (short-subunit alcohol dehydrogenase family)
VSKEFPTQGPLAGRVAFVTGAGTGIGRATAMRLAADGAAVGCLGRRVDAVEAVVREIEAAGGRAIATPADVTDPEAVGRAWAAVADAFGTIDILVNNAGIPGSGRLVDRTFEDWRRVLDTHVDGAFHVTQAVLPGMIGQGWGRIVNIGSEAVSLGHSSVEYATAKAALVGFTRALARQVAPHGVLVNLVAPGPVDTPMMWDNTPDEIEKERQTVLIGRFLTPDEIAAAVAFLAGPGGAAFVGQTISPNGGTVFAS